jgi:signal transduction histidine kinase
LRPIRIVIAEDEFFISEMLRTMLTQQGYQIVAEATDGEEAIRLVCEYQPDIAIFDISMPRLDGLSAAKELQSLCPTPIVILTSHDSPQLVEEASRSGAGAYLTKPFQINELERALLLCYTRFQDQQRNLEIQRKQQQKQKRESLMRMAGGIAHDLNNLLTSMLGYIELAKEEAPQITHLQQHLQQLDLIGKKLSQLGNNLLLYSGHGFASPRLFSLHSLLQDLLPQWQALLAPHRLLLESHTQGEIEADPLQMQEMIWEILENAKESAEAIGRRESTITLHLSTQPFHPKLWDTDEAPIATPQQIVCLAIQDQGEGIHAEDQKKLFEPFYSTRFTGRGMGLGVVLGILRAHHGTLRIDSKLQQGSTFTLSLPAHTPLSPTQPLLSFPPPIQPRPLLFLESEPSIHPILRIFLERSHFFPYLVQEQEQAILLLEDLSIPFVAAVFDLTPPPSTALLHTLLTQRPALPLLLTSSHHAPHIPPHLNHHPFLQKPYTMHNLLHHLLALPASS